VSTDCELFQRLSAPYNVQLVENMLKKVLHAGNALRKEKIFPQFIVVLRNFVKPHLKHNQPTGVSQEWHYEIINYFIPKMAR